MAASFPVQSNSTAAVHSGSAQAAQPPTKLAKAAQEFESILLASWLEKMNQGFVGSEESQDPAHDTVSSLRTQAIASALAARGGIGIASMLLRQLQPTQPAKVSVMQPAANPPAPQPSASGKIIPEKD
jgi:Rod binding domain-containing protein